MTYKLFFLSALIFISAALGGCAPAALGLGAAAGVSSAQEGGIKGAARDAAIQVKINDLWFKHNVDMFRHLDMTVSKGRVLITGVVEDPDHRVEAVRLAWKPEGVTQVINEIQISDINRFKSFAKDTWITTRLRAVLTFDKQVQSINYSIDTVNGVVYLMGTAQDQAELDHVIELASTISGVQRVVSYVRMLGED